MLDIQLQNGLKLSPYSLLFVNQHFNAVYKNKDFLKQYFNWVDLYQNESIAKMYINQCLEAFQKGVGETFAIVYNGHYIGEITVFNINASAKKCEIGFWIDEDYTMQGLMTTILKWMIDYLFENKKMNKLVIHHTVDNQACEKLLLRLGFKQDGILRSDFILHDKFEDLVCMSLLKRDLNN